MHLFNDGLKWRIPGILPGGLPSMGSHRVGHDWSDLAGTAAAKWGTVHAQPGAKVMNKVSRILESIWQSQRIIGRNLWLEGSSEPQPSALVRGCPGVGGLETQCPIKKRARKLFQIKGIQSSLPICRELVLRPPADTRIHVCSSPYVENDIVCAYNLYISSYIT